MQSPRYLLKMKRPKSPSPPPPTALTPSTPPTPQQLQSFTKLVDPISKKRRNILQVAPPFPSDAVDTAGIKWKPLKINKSELYLPLTFPTGQTFRWRETGPIGPHLVSLKQLEDNHVGYYCHFTDDDDAARTDLFDFLNLGISLSEMWDEFRVSDERFAELALYLEGARVLRAKYIVGTVAALQSKPEGGIKWLSSLRKLDLQGAIDGLATLPGVGPKVAACIALFSLDQHHAIPVDTHVWKIATRYLIPELAGARLTPKLCGRVVDAFVSKYGKYAGWAQTLLFISELPSQKAILASSLSGSQKVRSEKLQVKIQTIQETKRFPGKKRKTSGR